MSSRSSAALKPADQMSKYEVLFHQSTEAMATLFEDGRVEEVNSSFTRLTQLEPPQILNQPWTKFAPKEGHEELPPHVRPLSESLLAEEGTYDDVGILRKDGKVRVVDLSVRHLDSQRAVILRDVTEKKQLERQLISKHTEIKNAVIQLEKKNAELHSMQQSLVEAGKMAALGELAAGIAHEINQPLQVIRGFAQELESGSLSPEDSSDYLNEIVTNADKMAKIIQYLRVFTRKSTEGFEETDVHEVIENSLKLVDHQFRTRGIQIEKRFGEVSRVYANPVQLEQVFINLGTNARDAIEATQRGSGKVTIETRDSGEFVEVRYQDDGCGMNEKTKKKIFNPFFTTKEVGVGMGLGMSMSFGILSRINASILVESEVRGGTSFLIRLPKDFRELG